MQQRHCFGMVKITNKRRRNRHTKRNCNRRNAFERPIEQTNEEETGTKGGTLTERTNEGGTYNVEKINVNTILVRPPE